MLVAAFMNTNDLRKLDAFQTRCLRRILDNLHSFISHIPNSEVLSRARAHRFSAMIKYSQLILFHKIAQLPSNNVMQTLFFEGGSMNLNEPDGKRRRGRPKNAWGTSVAKYATANVVSLPSRWWKCKARHFFFDAH